MSKSHRYENSANFSKICLTLTLGIQNTYGEKELVAFGIEATFCASAALGFTLYIYKMV